MNALHAKRMARPLVLAAIVFALALIAAARLVWQLDQHGVDQARAHASDLASHHARAIQTSLERALSASWSPHSSSGTPWRTIARATSRPTSPARAAG